MNFPPECEIQCMYLPISLFLSLAWNSFNRIVCSFGWGIFIFTDQLQCCHLGRGLLSLSISGWRLFLFPYNAFVVILHSPCFVLTKGFILEFLSQRHLSLNAISDYLIYIPGKLIVFLKYFPHLLNEDNIVHNKPLSLTNSISAVNGICVSPKYLLIWLSSFLFFSLGFLSEQIINILRTLNLVHFSPYFKMLFSLKISSPVCLL